MKRIPAMSLLHGRIAVVEDGRYEYLRNSQGQYRSPVRLAQKLPGEEVFILDIDGLERSSPNLKTVKKIAAFKDIWLDAGSQDADDMMDLFVADASEVVLGTKTLDSLEELKEAAELSDRIIFSLDYDDGVLSTHGDVASMSIEQLLEAVAEFRVNKVLLMDLGSHRDSTPVNLEIVKQLAGVFENVYVSAYVMPEDYDALEQAGVTAIIQDFRSMEAK